MKKRYWIAVVIAGIIFIVMSAYQFWGGLGKGDDAPEFVLRDLSGKEYWLTEYKGQIVFLNFWATWCGKCRVELPTIERINRDYTDKVEVLSILVDEPNPVESIARMKSFVPFTFPVLVDVDGYVADRYKVWGLPATFIIGKDGIIIKRYSDIVPEKEIKEALDKIL